MHPIVSLAFAVAFSAASIASASEGIDQAGFVAAVEAARATPPADEAGQKPAIDARDVALCALVDPAGGKFADWKGTVSGTQLDSYTNTLTLQINLADDFTLIVADLTKDGQGVNTVLGAGHPLRAAGEALAVGDAVTVSGRFPKEAEAAQLEPFGIYELRNENKCLLNVKSSNEYNLLYPAFWIELSAIAKAS